MAEKPLIETNPYLRDPQKYKESLVINVATSTAAEIGPLPSSIMKALEDHSDEPEKISLYDATLLDY